MTIWQEFDRMLPLAKAGAEKPLFPLRSAYITALEKVLDSCTLWFFKVNSMTFKSVDVSTEYLDIWSGSRTRIRPISKSSCLIYDS